MKGATFRSFVLVFIATLSFGCTGEATPKPGDAPPASFKECAEQGGAILKSFPAQCVSRDGKRFIEDEGGSRSRGGAGRACKDECGNGQCEEMVCMAIGCPCAETHQSCPQDCKE